MKKTRVIFVGGFLGAGKTSLLLKSAEQLQAQGYRTAVITNDQGDELVDTMLARNTGSGVVAEVTGGCFCCRFYDLIDAMNEVREAVQPDIILAEPVGSCTDISATVLKPLERDYPDVYEVAPFTVMVDPARKLDGFPDSVDSLLGWQLAEADIIAVSKADTMTNAEAQAQIERFRRDYPGKPVVSLSAHSGAGVAEWLTEASRPARARNVVPVDYIVYAEAEAALGWLNATFQLTSAQPFSLKGWVGDMLATLRDGLRTNNAEIAHVKMYAQADGCVLKAGVTDLLHPIDWELSDDCTVQAASATLNARVASEPDALTAAVRKAARQVGEASGVSAEFDHLECFSPSPPQPVFRLS
jgi:Ni2+-binding GTPase involved in maturation of urease and hydrogenase